MTAARFPVDAGHILAFARAIGDGAPTFTAVLEGGRAVPAPPTFVMAAAQFDPDYPLRPRSDRAWFGSGRGPGFTLAGAEGLHAEQHFEYHRPVRAGDVLYPSTVPGRSWTKHGRAGELVFTEQVTRFLDADGEPVVTARSVGVVTRPIPLPGEDG